MQLSCLEMNKSSITHLLVGRTTPLALAHTCGRAITRAYDRCRGTKYIVFCSRALPLNNLPTLSDTVIKRLFFSAAKNILFCREGTSFANRSPEHRSSSLNWAITNSHQLSVWLHVALVIVNSISLPVFDINLQLACSLLPMLLLLAKLAMCTDF